MKQKKVVANLPVTRPKQPVPPIVHDVLRSPGQPLDLATRAFMEPCFRLGLCAQRLRLRAAG